MAVEPRATPLPGDLQYYLDGALENLHISVFDYDTISLYGDPDILDRLTNHSGLRTPLRKIGTDVDAYAKEIALTLDTETQMMLVASALPYEVKQLDETVDFAARWNFEDETIGGCSKPFRKTLRCKADYSPTKGVRRYLYARSAIRRYIKVELFKELESNRRLASTIQSFPWPVGAVDSGEWIKLREQFRATTRAVYDARQRREFDTRYSAQELLKKLPRRLVRKARKVVTRSAAAASSVIGDDQVRKFLRKEPVDIVGNDVVFRLVGRLYGAGHGALTISLLTPDLRDLGKLCLYFEDTPTLDQVAAIALHVRAGEEHDLLSTGNLYNVTEIGAVHPLLKGRIPPPPDIAANDVVDLFMNGRRVVPQRHGYYEAKRAAADRYIKEVFDLYLDPIAVFIWGRCAKPMLEYRRSLYAKADAEMTGEVYAEVAAELEAAA